MLHLSIAIILESDIFLLRLFLSSSPSLPPSLPPIPNQVGMDTAENNQIHEDEAQTGPSKKDTKYDRQLRLWGVAGQKALSEAHVLLVNAG